jgi:hypothetical protein
VDASLILKPPDQRLEVLITFSCWFFEHTHKVLGEMHVRL